MGTSCGGTAFLGINWNCISGSEVLSLLFIGFCVFLVVSFIALSVMANITYLRGKWQEGKRLAFGGPRWEDKPKVKVVRKAKGPSNFVTWVLVILIVLAIVLPVTALIASN